MKMIVTIALLIVSISSSIGQQLDVNYQWRLKKDKNGIKVYTSKVPNSKFKAVRAEMTITGKISSLVALVSDNDACPEWADLCKESKTIEEISLTEKYVYSYNDIPFPVKDRDALTHVVWKQDTNTGKVSMTSTATKDRYPIIKKAVRIENALLQWHFTPLDNDRTLVESFAHIDPNGPTPAWLSNMMLVTSPFKTMENMRAIIESGRYADAKSLF